MCERNLAKRLRLWLLASFLVLWVAGTRAEVPSATLLKLESLLTRYELTTKSLESELMSSQLALTELGQKLADSEVSSKLLSERLEKSEAESKALSEAHANLASSMKSSEEYWLKRELEAQENEAKLEARLRFYRVAFPVSLGLGAVGWGLFLLCLR